MSGIIGIAVGLAILFAIVIVVVLVVWKKRNQRRNNEEVHVDDHTIPPPETWTQPQSVSVPYGTIPRPHPSGAIYDVGNIEFNVK